MGSKGGALSRAHTVRWAVGKGLHGRVDDVGLRQSRHLRGQHRHSEETWAVASEGDRSKGVQAVEWG